MPVVILHAPLRDRAGGLAEHEVSGTTVGEAIRSLERRHPGIVGWILDEQGRVRPHVNVFVNGDRGREDAPVAPGDVMRVLASISGGRT